MNRPNEKIQSKRQQGKNGQRHKRVLLVEWKS